MSIAAKPFEARVRLPYKLMCDGGLELSGMAVSIDTGSAVLALPEGPLAHPLRGQAVRLELQLPAGRASVPGRCLAVRARVAQVIEMRDGTRRVTVQFRKAAFKESEKAPRKPPKRVAAKGWEM
jgi:hypothetical protein